MRIVLYAVFFLGIVGGGLPVSSQDDDRILEAPDRQMTTGPNDTVIFSPDGNRVAIGGRDNLIRLYNAQTSELQAMLSGHTSWVTHLAFHPSGSQLISAGRDNTVRVWDLQTFTQVYVFQHHTSTVTGVDYSDNGLMLASASMDGTLWVGDATTGNTLAQLTNYSGAVWSVAFSPDSRTLVSGSEDGTLWIWGLYDSSVTTIEGDGSAVTAIDFDPVETSRLVTSGWDGSVRLWDIEAETLVRRYTGHAGPVTGVTFNADGDEIITSGLDGTVHIYDVETGWQKAVLRGNGMPLADLAFNPVTREIVSAGLDGGLEFWARDGRIETFIVSRPVPTEPPAIVQAPTIPPSGGNVDDLSFIPTSEFIPTAAPLQVQPTVADSLVFATGTPAPPQASQPTAPPAVAAAPPAPTGTSLSLPTVNIFSRLTSFSIEGNTWAIDPWEPAVGHFQGTAWVQHNGNIVLGGHSEYPDGSRGIFNGLYGVNVGDPIYLTVDGEQRRYTVVEMKSVDYRDISVVRPTSDNRLTLITCDIPSFDPGENIYWERLVVVAVLG